jgi:hypothetical protein
MYYLIRCVIAYSLFQSCALPRVFRLFHYNNTFLLCAPFHFIVYYPSIYIVFFTLAHIFPWILWMPFSVLYSLHEGGARFPFSSKPTYFFPPFYHRHLHSVSRILFSIQPYSLCPLQASLSLLKRLVFFALSSVLQDVGSVRTQ